MTPADEPACLYTVMVDDNFHYMDEDERREYGRYPTLDAAIAICRQLVERSLTAAYKPGMSAAQLFDHYRSFGDDPFILREPPYPETTVPFSAWTFARERAEAICR